MSKVRKIESFKADHDKIEPGIYISRTDGDLITYDMRTRKPNCGNYMDNITMHTVEHMFASLLCGICENRLLAGLDHNDGADGAGLPAEAAAQTPFRVRKGGHGADIPPLPGLGDGQAPLGAVLHAHAAPGADGGVHRGLGPFRLGDLLHRLPPVVSHGSFGAQAAAGAAAHANLSVDGVGLLHLAGDGLHRAIPSAQGAAHAGCRIDGIRAHSSTLRTPGS